MKDEPGYNNKVDIWSLGCILYELVVGSKAFSHDFATLQYAQGNEVELQFPQLWHFDSRAQSLAMSLVYTSLETDWWLRPTTRAVLDVLATYDQVITQVTVGRSHHEMVTLHKGPAPLSDLLRRKFSEQGIAGSQKVMLSKADEALWSYVKWMPIWY